MAKDDSLNGPDPSSAESKQSGARKAASLFESQKKWLVRADKNVSLVGGIVHFEMNQEISDPQLVEIARLHGVPLLSLESEG